MPNSITTKRRLKRMTFLVAACLFVAFILLSWFMPLPGYFSKLSSSVLAHGLSRETWSEFVLHSNWLARYFNGPPSDSEMIRYLSARRDAFEKVAIFEIMGKCRKDENAIDDRLQPDGECGKLLLENDLWVGPAMESFPNSVYRLGSLGQVHADGARISRRSVEPQAWRSTNRHIRYWEKFYVYVPALIKTIRASDNPLDIFKLNNLVVDNLDIPPKLINDDPYLHDCAVRKVDMNWFLMLCANPEL